ncbi:endonuclease domain-containing protein [Streptomyces crystallinus]|uniref:endonuclease domain-containing protein n=1 Tax=Streptomyces crystallinus TaxID=68191 RepID=UPI003CD0AF37
MHYGRGISQFARDAIFTLQGGRCLCGTENPGQTGWHLDHAHSCMSGHKPANYCSACVRGLLCIQCNRHAIAWYEGSWKSQLDNEPIALFEEWINRRIRFHGPVDSPEVRVSLHVTPAVTTALGTPEEQAVDLSRLLG